MAVNFFTIAIDGLVDTDSQRANAGDVKKLTSAMIRLFLTNHAHHHCPLICFFSVNSPSLTVYNFLIFAIDGLIDADSRRVNAGDKKKINKRDD